MLAVLLWRLHAVNAAARVWCWLFGLSTLVFGVPGLAVYFRHGHDTTILINLILTLCIGCSMWFLVLPLWRPFQNLTDR
jgi:uncharacterized membrane protein YqaE (UPF0057 family)